MQYSIAVALLEIICEKKKESTIGEKEKKGIVNVDDIFFCFVLFGSQLLAELTVTYTPQQNRNPF